MPNIKDDVQHAEERWRWRQKFTKIKGVNDKIDEMTNVAPHLNGSSKDQA